MRAAEKSERDVFRTWAKAAGVDLPDDDEEGDTVPNGG
jgi:hypothetical protein